MTPEVLLDAHGRPIYVQGYAGVFDSPRADGHPEIVRPQAFDRVLKHPRAGFNLQFHHGGLEFIAGSFASDTLQVWSDDFGLAFQAGPYTACGRNVALLGSIARGEIRGASWSGSLSTAQFENLNGERTRVIRRFSSLDHIAVVAEGAYPDAGCWLSSEYPYDLPRRLRALSEIWAASRPRHDTGRALRRMARKVKALPRRAVTPSAMSRPSQVRAVVRHRAPASAPLAMSEVYFDGFGFSGSELARLALQERKSRRTLEIGNPGISRANMRRRLLRNARGAA